LADKPGRGHWRASLQPALPAEHGRG
jgi:hypothetical protein